jgi:hypothetical protein
VYGGYAADQLQFIDNVDADTSIYRIKKKSFGHYGSGAWRSIGAVPFYLIAQEVISGTTWNTVATGNRVLWGSGSYALNTIPCYVAATSFGTEGDEAGVDDIAEITVSRNPCPIWEPPGWWYGNITAQSATSLSVVAINDAGTWKAGATLKYGLKFKIASFSVTGATSGVGYHDENGVNTGGIPPINAIITDFYALSGSSFSITVTGTIVP